MEITGKLLTEYIVIHMFGLLLKYINSEVSKLILQKCVYT